jgi:16S rRNA (uracil1498-N3)-methyltransferase
MTRRRFYAPPETFTGDRTSVKLSADETQHLRNVLRLKAGDEVFVFDGEGREFRGHIDINARDATTIRIIDEVSEGSYESPLHLTMAVALLKGEKFDQIVQKLTELGVNRVIPVINLRADVRLRSDADAARRMDRWQRIAMEATKQCGRSRLMEIAKPIALQHLIEQPQAEGEQRFMFSERDGDSLQDAIGRIPHAPAVTAVIGSEGGWANEEIDQTRAAGWKVVTLPGRIMRAETAAIVIAALLQHRFGDLK